MKNYVQPGAAITLAAPKAVLSGEGLLVGALFGVASGTAAAGAPLTIETEGVYELPKAPDALAVGDPLYWDADAGRVTADADTGGNRFVGHAVAIAGSGVAAVRVRLSV